MLAAVDLALSAIVESQGSEVVGSHQRSYAAESGFAIHEFDCLLPGYPHWNWTVVLACAPDQTHPTVCDVVLLPGDGALVPPQWIPWSQRIRPGDIGPGDVLPSDPNDVRLVAGYEATDTDSDDVLDAVWELGLGRERVLSQEGRDGAAHRWFFGGTGPESTEARLAPHPCATCGFFVGLKGVLNQAFGVCANELSSADGRVVSTGFGCGAHSGIKATPVASQAPLAAVDEIDYEVLDATELKGLPAAGTQSDDADDAADSTDSSADGTENLAGAGESDGADALDDSANSRDSYESGADDGDNSADSEDSATSRDPDDAGDAYAFEAFDDDADEDADAPISSSDEHSSPNQAD